MSIYGLIGTKKREFRTCCLSCVPGLRTCLLRKISNFEAHADMYISNPYERIKQTNDGLQLQRGCVYNTSRGHLPLHHHF